MTVRSVTVTVAVSDGDVDAARELLRALEAEAFCAAHGTPEQLAVAAARTDRALTNARRRLARHHPILRAILETPTGPTPPSGSTASSSSAATSPHEHTAAAADVTSHPESS